MLIKNSETSQLLCIFNSSINSLRLSNAYVTQLMYKLFKTLNKVSIETSSYLKLRLYFLFPLFVCDYMFVMLNNKHLPLCKNVKEYT